MGPFFNKIEVFYTKFSGKFNIELNEHSLTNTYFLWCSGLKSDRERSEVCARQVTETMATFHDIFALGSKQEF